MLYWSDVQRGHLHHSFHGGSPVKDVISTLEKYLTPVGLAKLLAIPNQDVHRFVAKAVELCEPMKVFVCTDAPEDIEYIRRNAIARGEETQLAIDTHSVHFDGFFDQARRWLLRPST